MEGRNRGAGRSQFHKLCELNAVPIDLTVRIESCTVVFDSDSTLFEDDAALTLILIDALVENLIYPPNCGELRHY